MHQSYFIMMRKEDFEKLVVRALENLPTVFKDSLENVDVVVEDEPSQVHAEVLDFSHKRLVLGLYQGVPLLKRNQYYGMVMPDKVSIFQKNIEKICRTDEDIINTVTHTVQHELAHHLGISDDRLRELGIY